MSWLKKLYCDRFKFKACFVYSYHFEQWNVIRSIIIIQETHKTNKTPVIYGFNVMHANENREQMIKAYIFSYTLEEK